MVYKTLFVAIGIIGLNKIEIIAICSIAITVIVSIYPALKASRMNTSKALKYE